MVMNWNWMTHAFSFPKPFLFPFCFWVKMELEVTQSRLQNVYNCVRMSVLCRVLKAVYTEKTQNIKYNEISYARCEWRKGPSLTLTTHRKQNIEYIMYNTLIIHSCYSNERAWIGLFKMTPLENGVTMVNQNCLPWGNLICHWSLFNFIILVIITDWRVSNWEGLDYWFWKPYRSHNTATGGVCFQMIWM